MRTRSRSPLVSGTMSQFLAKVEAIRKALGLRPAEELPAPLAISEAMVLMGINANVSWALPEKVEALVEALDLPGFGKSPAATQAPAPPAPPAPSAQKPAATTCPCQHRRHQQKPWASGRPQQVRQQVDR